MWQLQGVGGTQWGKWHRKSKLKIVTSMVWLLLCKEYKLHMGNRLVGIRYFSQVGYIESLKERN